MFTSPTVTLPSAALRLSGRDALLVLHRISTQALEDLAPGEARTTLFCDYRGRLLHRAAVAHAADGGIWLLRADAPGDTLAAFVDRYVFREDLKIDDRSAMLPVRWLAGDLAPDTCRWRGETPARVGILDGIELAVGDANGTALDEAARIRLGIAAHGHEIAETFTPYEVGLAPSVHLNKGCYTGQEALMRFVTYDSVRRGLALVRGTGELPAVPADVAADGEGRGVLTSVVREGRGWIGLAVLGRDAMGDGARFTLVDDRTLEVSPFPETRALGRS